MAPVAGSCGEGDHDVTYGLDKWEGGILQRISYRIWRCLEGIYGDIHGGRRFGRILQAKVKELLLGCQRTTGCV